VLSSKSSEELDSAEVRLLHDVFGIVIISGNPPRQIVGRAQMWKHRLLETREFCFFRHSVLRAPGSSYNRYRLSGEFIPESSRFF
jgi:hypothetical protein